MEKQRWRSVLKSEFDAEDGSFLLGLRTGLVWDELGFERLTAAMAECCLDMVSASQLDRWLAEGFWFTDTFVRSWTNHEAWQTRSDREAIDAGVQRLSDLAYWFFFGESPWIDGLGPYD